ncbi:disease resistance protein RPP13 [Vigna radiata var. radiata]|uniref:Disease resistance protein RPP13 n=1 Tax=Vigna radiata var. radiata TaxID=3916 RepID=A0A1S3TW98_VIGRR|nr:disease resistance protein RPP13 [Vigna radiata var. radiata]
MADSIVVFLIDKLTRLLVEEAKLLTGVRDQVTSLQSELRFMNLFLRNSQGKRKEHDMVAELVSQIRDVAHEAEDVIDTYVACIIKQSRRNVIGKVGFRGVDHALMLHQVAVKVDGIKARIKEIFDNKERYGIEDGRRGSEEEAERIRKQRREVEEEEVVGFALDSKVVIEKLMVSDSRLKVVSVVGMGGLGKTTLARKVYNSNRVKNVFPCRAWGYVSNDYRPREFFLSLLKCLLSTSKYSSLFKKREETSVSDEELKMKVRECLNRSKYLVVVDDVWQKQVWNEVKGAFPDDQNGSRILMTTRSAEVASHAGPVPPYALPFLTKEESWELLSKKVFRGGEDCPSDLESLGKLIADSCDGLPLALVVMAGILANKMSPRDWSRIKDHVNWHLGRDNTLKDILKLSYDSLPARLKPCFLYFGMYPEDYRIPVKQLIQLWISEGLLTQETSGGQDIPEPEYIAEEYLDELVDRSLIQVVSRTNDGGVKTCRIHDLLRDLCISESREDKFFEVCGEIDIQNLNSCPRKLSLQGTLFHFSSSMVSDYTISATRSLLCFGQEVYKVKANHWRWLLKSFRLARVLDLGRMNVNSIPTDLEKLIHLRYLRIHSHNLETIPPSICRLWNLETLDLRGSPIKSFSGELWQLKQLRHLLLFGPVGLPEMPSESKTMPNLQTLSTVALDPRTASLLDSRRFPGMTKLGIHYERRDKCNARIQLQSLHRLSHLRKLKVIGTTEIPQNANVFPSNINKISLTKFGFFNSTVMHTLGKLPNLQVLKLSSQTNDTRFDLHCATGGFLQLQVFEMIAIKVKMWRVDRGSMPRVRRLVVRSCKSLTQLPKEVWSLNTLREVQVLWPCTELAKGLQNLVMNNGCKLVVYPLSANDELDFL